MRTFFYFFLLAMTCIGALFSPIPYSYVPFLLVCSSGIVALLYRRYLKSVQLTVAHTEAQSIELTLQQKWRVPVHVHYEATYEHFISKEVHTVHGNFFSNERIHKEQLQLTSPFCGQLVFTSLRVIYSDSLPFITVKVEETPACSVFQMPAIALTEAAVSMRASSMEMGTEAGAKERLAPYMPGDAVSAIHWAMSARTQSLVVRKEAFAVEQRVQGVALYFNEVTNVAQYDACMTAYYNLLRQHATTTAYVWEQRWVMYHLSSMHDIDQLFRTLFSMTLQQLYADSPPPANIISLQLEGDDKR